MFRRIRKETLDACLDQISRRQAVDGSTPFLSFMLCNMFNLVDEKLFAPTSRFIIYTDKENLIQAACLLEEQYGILVSRFTANGNGSGRKLFEYIYKLGEKENKVIWLEPFVSAEGFYRKMGMEYYMDQFMYLIPSSFNGDEQIILRQISSHLTK